MRLVCVPLCTNLYLVDADVAFEVFFVCALCVIELVFMEAMLGKYDVFFVVYNDVFDSVIVATSTVEFLYEGVVAMSYVKLSVVPVSLVDASFDIFVRIA